MKSPTLLLLRRRRRGTGTQTSDSSDGLMDILSNVVGVMALVGSLTGVLAQRAASTFKHRCKEKQI